MSTLLKIFVDYFFSLLGLIIFLPLIFAVSILSLIIQGGPIFYYHKRLGKNAQPFFLIKFRTMTNEPSVSAELDEKRITKWGRLLRRSSIDELPVVINVLKGEMSIVGPRPMPVKYLERFNNYQLKRLRMKPGITGLAQINGRNKISWERRFNLDVKYIENNSLLIDLNIIFRTVFLVIRGYGVRSNRSEIMPEFLGNKKKNDKPSEKYYNQ